LVRLLFFTFNNIFFTSEEFIYADSVPSTGGVLPVSRNNTKFFFKKSINNRRENRYYSTLRSPSKEDEEFYL
jgi:hypothetical protein